MKDIQETKNGLKKLLRKNGYRVYIVQRSVSASGMTRKLDCFAIVGHSLWRITDHVAEVLGWKVDRNGYLIVRGCGMDMHFHTVYSLSCALYNKGKYSEAGAYKLNHYTI